MGRFVFAALVGAVVLISAFAGSASALAQDASKIGVIDGNSQAASLETVLDGRRAVIHLWATWCAPCLEELPELADFLAAEPHLASHVVVLSVDTAPYSRVERFLRQRLMLPELASLKVVKGEMGSEFGVRGYPTTLFVDESASVVERRTGMVDWRDPATKEALAAHFVK